MPRRPTGHGSTNHRPGDQEPAAAPLRRGWTTGACATAAAKAAFAALGGAPFPDPVTITLPGGGHAAFALALAERGPGWTRVGVVKDAGDDPDVTHGALVVATLRPAAPGTGVVFAAGQGVGTVTLPGLALAPGEPAINPVPRRMIAQAVAEVAAASGQAADVAVELSIPGGEKLAERTLNPRLGIVGGLSILGTTGIVIPYSCAAWVHSIQRGIDVARAAGLTHVAGVTGKTSETAIRALHGLDEMALIDMGDFVGGMLKYLRAHPVARVTVAGGIAKMTKLAQGQLDLHSKRARADLGALSALARGIGTDDALCAAIATAPTVAQAFHLAATQGVALGHAVAEAAWTTAAGVLKGSPTALEPMALEVALFDRQGRLAGRAPFRVAA